VYNAPVTSPAPRALLAALLLAGAAALPAAAGDGQVILRLRDGRLVPGKVVSMDDEGVRHASEPGTAFWPWSAITPYGRYEVRAAFAAEDDGPARLALGRWCLEAGLPSEARAEFLRARGLGAGEASELDALAARCDREQAALAFEGAEALAGKGDLDGAIGVLRSWLAVAPLSSWTEEGRERAADLVRRREAEEVRRRLEEEQAKKDAAEARRGAAIADLMEKADGGRTEAGTLVLAALREEDGGSFSVFRGSLEKAEAWYRAAAKNYERARRLAANDRPPEARLALASRRAVEGRLLDLHVRLARRFVDFRSWKDAQEALDKALRIDPVNAEALDLQDRVNANWIRRKVSSTTGATGRTSDGSGGGR